MSMTFVVFQKSAGQQPLMEMHSVDSTESRENKNRSSSKMVPQ